MPKGIPRQGHVAIGAPVRKTNDAQLFAQKRSTLQGQTDERSQLLHCQNDLTAPAFTMIPVFHGISRAEGPFKQTTKSDRLSHHYCPSRPAFSRPRSSPPWKPKHWPRPRRRWAQTASPAQKCTKMHKSRAGLARSPVFQKHDLIMHKSAQRRSLAEHRSQPACIL